MKLCGKGLHDLDDPAVAYIRPSDGGRFCRPCRREYNHQRYAANQERIRENSRKWVAANPERIRETTRQWYAANQERICENNRKYVAALKLEALNTYGGLRCAYCGETDPAKLSLDHVNEDGAEHRLELMGDERQTGTHFYSALKKLGWPQTPPLQVLCATCHQRKTADCRIIRAFMEEAERRAA